MSTTLDALMAQARDALVGMDEAYCRAGSPLSRDERTQDRKRLISARAAAAALSEALADKAQPAKPETLGQTVRLALADFHAAKGNNRGDEYAGMRYAIEQDRSRHMRELHAAGLFASAQPVALAAPVAVPQGWRLAPEVATPEMLVAVASFPDHLRAQHPDPEDPWHKGMAAATLADQMVAAQQYRAMLAAAPPAPAVAPAPSAAPAEGARWLPIDGRYSVSSYGLVKDMDGNLMGQSRNSDGYLIVRLSGPRRLERVHRLVAKAFVLNPLNLDTVNHIDCDRTNNSAGNLEWCTQAQNLAHSDNLGRMQRDYWSGRRSPNARLSDDEVKAIRSAYASGGVSYETLSSQFGVSRRCIGRVVNMEVYSDVQ